LQREDFQQLRPGLGHKLRFEPRAEVLEHLLNLQIALRFDGLAVQVVTGRKPVPQQARLTHAPPAIHHQQSAPFRCGVQFAQFRFPVHEIQFHAGQHARDLDVCQTLCLRSIMLAGLSLGMPGIGKSTAARGALLRSRCD